MRNSLKKNPASSCRSISAMLALMLGLAHGAVYAHEGKTISGLKMPESAVQAKDGQVYVSEIGEFGKDGDGQIAVIDAQGNKKVFASGLNDPKGLAFIGRDLYVADKTRILKITPDGKSQVYVEANAFHYPPQFLNDLVADPLGNLYISDTGDMKGGGGAVYRVSPNGKVTLLLDNKKDPGILGPNGLLVDDSGHGLLVVDFVSGVLYRYDMKNDTLSKLAEGFGGGDGLVQTAKGVLYVSDYNNGKVFRVSKDSDHKVEVKLIKDGFKSAADITLTNDGKYILVPDMKAGELVYLPIH